MMPTRAFFSIWTSPPVFVAKKFGAQMRDFRGWLLCGLLATLITATFSLPTNVPFYTGPNLSVDSGTLYPHYDKIVSVQILCFLCCRVAKSLL